MDIFENSFEEIIRCQSLFCLLEMETIFPLDEIMIHEISSETHPESIGFFGIEGMPEVRVEILASFEKVEDIREEIIFVDMNFFCIWYLSKSVKICRIFEDYNTVRCVIPQ